MYFCQFSELDAATYVGHRRLLCRGGAGPHGVYDTVRHRSLNLKSNQGQLFHQVRPMLESIYCNVIYTGKMGTALIPKVNQNGVNPHETLNHFGECLD